MQLAGIRVEVVCTSRDLVEVVCTSRDLVEVVCTSRDLVEVVCPSRASTSSVHSHSPFGFLVIGGSYLTAACTEGKQGSMPVGMDMFRFETVYLSCSGSKF